MRAALLAAELQLKYFRALHIRHPGCINFLALIQVSETPNLMQGPLELSLGCVTNKVGLHLSIPIWVARLRGLLVDIHASCRKFLIWSQICHFRS